MSVAIWCWGKDKRILDDARAGHVAIEAQNYIWGFYPVERVVVPSFVPGELKIQDEDENADDYFLKCIDRPDKWFNSKKMTIDEKSGLIVSKEAPLPTAHTFSLSLSKSIHEKLDEILRETRKSPPNYHIHENNCVKVTIQILDAAGIFSENEFDPIKESRAPWHFLTKLVKLTETSDLITGYQTKQIAWINDAYHWINA